MIYLFLVQIHSTYYHQLQVVLYLCRHNKNRAQQSLIFKYTYMASYPALISWWI